MGTLSGDGYYQEVDEARYYDSWEAQRDLDRENGISRPDSYYRERYIPAKQAIMQGLHDSSARQALEKQAASLGGYLSPDGTTIMIPVMSTEKKVEAKDRYAINKAAKVGDTIECACCGKSLVKTNYQQAFCPPINSRRGKRYKCKDKYHNVTNPVRAARANQWSTK